MREHQLPSELNALEHALVKCRPPAPRAELRWRVLGSVRGALERERRWAPWRFAAAVAAAVLLWLNLSLCITQATDFGLRAQTRRDALSAGAEQIRRLAPELSPEEARRQAVLLQAGANLACCPELPPTRDLRGQAGTWRTLLSERH